MSIDIGKRVLQIRSSVGLSQRDFAARLGISSGGISQIESGKAMPGGEFLSKIHQEFGVDLTWLLTGVSGGNEPSSMPPSLTPRQSALLDNYEHLSEEDKTALERMAFALAEWKKIAKKGKVA